MKGDERLLNSNCSSPRQPVRSAPVLALVRRVALRGRTPLSVIVHSERVRASSRPRTASPSAVATIQSRVPPDRPNRYRASFPRPVVAVRALRAPRRRRIRRRRGASRARWNLDESRAPVAAHRPLSRRTRGRASMSSLSVEPIPRPSSTKCPVRPTTAVSHAARDRCANRAPARDRCALPRASKIPLVEFVPHRRRHPVARSPATRVSRRRGVSRKAAPISTFGRPSSRRGYRVVRDRARRYSYLVCASLARRRPVRSSRHASRGDDGSRLRRFQKIVFRR